MRDYKKSELYPNSKMLSSSQLTDYFKSPKDFFIRWVVGVEGTFGAACMVGMAFSELYADRSFDFRSYLIPYKPAKRLVELLGEVIKFFPKPNKPEHELKVSFKGWKFRITLDDFYEKYDTIVENKTSAYEYNDYVVANHTQITLQQWGFWKKYKRLPKDHIVNWVDTKSGATKKITTLHAKRTLQELKDFEELVETAIENLEAKNFTKNFIKYDGEF